MFLNEFKELSMEELLSVNGGYTNTSSSSHSKVPAGYSPTTGWYSDADQNKAAMSHSKVPEGYSPTTGWLPGWGPDGYTDPNQKKATEPAASNVPASEKESSRVNPLGSTASVTGGFGSSYDANKDGILDLHTGVDMVSKTREVSSTRRGVVLYSGVHPDGKGVATGTLVIIQYNDGNYGLYGHMDPNDLKVAAGDSVAAGSSLGKYYNGAMGMSTGGHLHYSEFSGSLSTTGDDLARQFNRTGYFYSGTGDPTGATLWNGLTVAKPNF
ncbi:MAG TPA: M23 family metallopeptidase [Treponemataceae bacterium]|nr:M23 family metallopeptidase [Treponemataceae bacterium]